MTRLRTLANLADQLAAQPIRPMTERDRQLVQLALRSPMRPRTTQDDVADTPLFIAANEPPLI